jgi:putative oxidoreductase
MKTATLIIRYLFGAFILFFGLNKFFHFMNPPMTDPAVITYFTGLMSTKTIALVGAIEVLAGIAFLANAYVALACVVLIPVSINAVMFHAMLDTANIGGALMMLVFNVFLMFAYKEKYEALLKIR